MGLLKLLCSCLVFELRSVFRHFLNDSRKVVRGDIHSKQGPTSSLHSQASSWKSGLPFDQTSGLASSKNRRRSGSELPGAASYSSPTAENVRRHDLLRLLIFPTVAQTSRGVPWTWRAILSPSGSPGGPERRAAMVFSRRASRFVLLIGQQSLRSDNLVLLNECGSNTRSEVYLLF